MDFQGGVVATRMMSRFEIAAAIAIGIDGTEEAAPGERVAVAGGRGASSGRGGGGERHGGVRHKGPGASLSDLEP